MSNKKEKSNHLIQSLEEIISEVEFFIVCDLETTGVDVMRCDWITGSFSRVRCSDFFVESELELKSRPENHWDDEARYIHRIPRHKAETFPPRAESLERLVEWLPERSRFAFVCHANPRPFSFATKQFVNSHFDLAMIKWDFCVQDKYFDFYKHFDEKKVISTKTIATHYFEIPKEFDLKQVCEAMGIKMIGDHHDANADRKASEEILRRFLNESGRNTFRDRGSKLDSRIFEVQENNRMEEQQRFNV